METNPCTLLLVALSFFLISFLYSSAGFGGGSSYLAIMALALHDFHLIRSNALLCNIAVVGIGCWVAYKEGKLKLPEALPYVILSVPAAFIGAQLPLSERIFFIFLGISLFISALAIFIQNSPASGTERSKGIQAASFMGGGIGFLSGVVGMGGGIFLSPILNLLRWETAHQAARISSLFILVNSISGVLGLALAGSFKVSPQVSLILIASVIFGGSAGVALSIRKLRALTIKRVTAILVLAAGLRILWIHGFLS